MIYNSLELANALSGTCSEEFDKDKLIRKVSSDSRAIVGEGNLFVALRGDRFDGHSFVEKVTEGGNNFALVEDEKYMGRNTILVKDVRKALYDVACSYREKFLADKKCVAVTGSVGKTSTKEYVNAVIASKYRVYKSPGNHNSYTGLPMVMLNCDGKCDYLVLELGMNTAGEIEKLSHLVTPDVGIITNIGWSHSEYLGGRDKIYKEKLDITSGMKNGILVVNDDDDMLSGKIEKGCEIIRCSVSNPNADFYAKDIVVENGIISFTVDGKKLVIRQAGVHNVKNALLAYAAGVCSGVGRDEASEALASLKASEGRIKVREGKNGCTVIEDCYNASPESMKAALEFLGNSKNNKIAVLGDMLELGDESERLHEEVGKYAASCCDELFCYGDLGRFIAKGAENAGHKNVQFYDFEKRDEFVRALSLRAANSTVLFKASNRMRFPEIIEKMGI